MIRRLLIFFGILKEFKPRIKNPMLELDLAELVWAAIEEPLKKLEGKQLAILCATGEIVVIIRSPVIRQIMDFGTYSQFEEILKITTEVGYKYNYKLFICPDFNFPFKDYLLYVQYAPDDDKSEVDFPSVDISKAMQVEPIEPVAKAFVKTAGA